MQALQAGWGHGGERGAPAGLGRYRPGSLGELLGLAGGSGGTLWRQGSVGGNDAFGMKWDGRDRGQAGMGVDELRFEFTTRGLTMVSPTVVAVSLIPGAG